MPGPVTVDQPPAAATGVEVFIRRAVADPGQFCARLRWPNSSGATEWEYETIPAWGARAVIAALGIVEGATAYTVPKPWDGLHVEPGDDPERAWLATYPTAMLLHAALGADRPRIVCLCGSTRFYDEFQQANYDLTMAGHIVLSVGFYPHAKAKHSHGEGVGHDSAEKVALDELHKRKIDLADWVLVVSDATGYVGPSTRSEIAYAEKLGKPIRYLNDPKES